MHTVQLRSLIFPIKVEGIGGHINLWEQKGSGASILGFSRHIFRWKLLQSDVKRVLPKEYACGVRLLAPQKPINRPGWWKGKFALFQMPATGNGVDSDGYLSKNQLLPAGNQWGKSFYRQEGAACRDSTAISDSHLQIGHQWSDQCHLGCFRCG